MGRKAVGVCSVQRVAFRACRAGDSLWESFSWSERTYLEGAARTGTEPPILGGMQAEATQKHLGEL